jgi:Holliday junction resolvase RusA-like endonuclease
MDAVVSFVVPGEPVPQPRARVSTRGGFARAYVPGKHPVHEYRKRIAAAAKEAGLKNTGKPLYVRISAMFQRPKSHLRKSGVRDDAPVLPRPDVDNIAKGVLDALQGVMGDDALVGCLQVAKAYGPASGTVVTVSELIEGYA